MPRATEWEWRHEIRRSNLSPSAKYVAFTMALYANPDGSRCRPGTRNLIADTGRTNKTVLAALAELQDTKWVILTRPGTGRRADEFELNIPGDVWQEILAEHPEEVMRRDRAENERSGGVSTPQQGFAVESVHRNDPGDPFSPGEPPSPPRSGGVSTPQTEFVLPLCSPSGVVTPPHLDLVRDIPPPNPPLTRGQELEVAGGGETLRSKDQNPTEPGYRDPGLWRAALRTADDNNPTNRLAYANTVYRRLAQEAQAALEAERANQAIDNCDTCTQSGLRETTDGWIRCNHQE